MYYAQMQRQHRHFKSGRATANKCAQGGEEVEGVYNRQCEKQTNLAEKSCTQRSSFQMAVSETGKTGWWGVSTRGLRVGLD